MKKTLTFHSKRQGILLGIRLYFPENSSRQLNQKSLQRSTRCLMLFASTIAILLLSGAYAYGSVSESNSTPFDWRDGKFLHGTYNAHIAGGVKHVVISAFSSKRYVVKRIHTNYHNPSQL